MIKVYWLVNPTRQINGTEFLAATEHDANYWKHHQCDVTDLVPKKDYDALKAKLDKAVAALKQIDNDCSAFREALAEIGKG